jgi:hypothetical protein
MHRRSFAALVGAFVLAGALAAAAPADTVPQGGGADNIVVSSTHTDGTFVARARTLVTQTSGTTVASSNIADASAAGCTSCHATAVAVQAVVFSGSPRYYTPGNAATATNSDCLYCGTYAYAWQYLVQVDAPFTLSPAAEQRVADLRSKIDETADSVVPATIDDDQLLDLELNGLTAQLRETVDAAVSSSGTHEIGPPVVRASIQRG